MTKQLYKEGVMIKRILGLFLLVGLFLLAGCAQPVQPVNSTDTAQEYNQTSQEKTQEMTVDEPEETVTEEKEAEEMITEEELQVVRMSAELVLEVNGKRFYPELAENSSAEAFFEKLKEGKLDLELHDYGSFEKVGPLPWELPRNDEQITTEPGDIILYQGNQLTIYYDENTWSFTRLGKIKYVTKEELLEALGDGDVTVSFWLEWSE